MCLSLRCTLAEAFRSLRISLLVRTSRGFR